MATDFALPTIELPQRCRDGIGASAANLLWLRIGPCPAFEPGDLLEVFIDERFASAMIIKPEHLGMALDFHVPQAILRSGVARLGYQWLRAGEHRVHAPTTKVLAKLECPGGPPLFADEEENQYLPALRFPLGLSLRQARRHGGLPFYLPVYPNMAGGDEITVRWGDARFDLPPLLPRQVAGPVHSTVPLAILTQARPGQWRELTWSVVDRVGNHSRWAPCQALGLPDSSGTR